MQESKYKEEKEEEATATATRALDADNLCQNKELGCI
jgi:hypothetical protein